MTEMPAPQAFAAALPASAPYIAIGDQAIGMVLEIAGSSSQILLDRQALEAVSRHPDPVVASAGSVGSQVKVRVGSVWLIANIRSLKLLDADSDCIAAQVDFLGEGDEEKLTGKLYKSAAA